MHVPLRPQSHNRLLRRSVSLADRSRANPTGIIMLDRVEEVKPHSMCAVMSNGRIKTVRYFLQHPQSRAINLPRLSVSPDSYHANPTFGQGAGISSLVCPSRYPATSAVNLSWPVPRGLRPGAAILAPSWLQGGYYGAGGGECQERPAAAERISFLVSRVNRAAKGRVKRR